MTSWPSVRSSTRGGGRIITGLRLISVRSAPCVRIATCISGRVEAVVNCGPQFNYGTTGGTWSYTGDGYDSMTITPTEGDVQLELAGSIPLGVLGARCYGRTTLTQGQSAFVALSWAGGDVPANQDEASPC